MNTDNESYFDNPIFLGLLLGRRCQCYVDCKLYINKDKFFNDRFYRLIAINNIIIHLNNNIIKSKKKTKVKKKQVK